MRSAIWCLLLGCACAVAGSKDQQRNVAVVYPGLSVAFVHQPLSGEGTSLPFLHVSGTSERCGVYFDSVSPSFRWIEILDAKGATIGGLSIGDALSGRVPRRVRLTPNNGLERPRRAESSYTLTVHRHELDVITKALAVGEEGSDEQLLVVTFGLKSQGRRTAALRVNMPIMGKVTHGAQGVAVMPRRGDAALVLSVFPRVTTKLGGANIFSITSQPVRLAAGQEQTMFWCVIRGIPASSSPAHLMKKALSALQHDAEQASKRRVLALNLDAASHRTHADTITYMVVCLNAGTLPVPSPVIESQVPEGARFVDDSASPDLQLVRIGRDERDGTPFFRWNLQQVLAPGEEHISTFRVVLSDAGFGQVELPVRSEARHR